MDVGEENHGVRRHLLGVEQIRRTLQQREQHAHVRHQVRLAQPINNVFEARHGVGQRFLATRPAHLCVRSGSRRRVFGDSALSNELLCAVFLLAQGRVLRPVFAAYREIF